ncbi:SH3 domain-containing protein [Schnuerera ultunensis]|uniref:SH3 domain-containing protein n=1 Tax=Schnuerera ultunensis TaxID=45497 RepID=UPI00041837B1|nr:SH3 domain-containing protein [Schnuerera ultunensis]
MKEKNKIIVIILLLVVTVLLFRLEKNINRGKEVIQIDEEPILYTIKDPEFWIDKIEDKGLLLMNSMEIEQFNRKIFSQFDFLMDLENHVDSIKGEELKDLIKNISKPSKEIGYDREGNIMDADYFNRLIYNSNLESLPASIPIKYGVTTNRTMIRTFPTLEPSYREKDDTHFDRFMETAIYPWEPLVIYSESADGEWYFGRMYNYLGWIPKKDMAIGQKEEIFHYINLESFLIVIDKQIYVDDILLDMGVRIPIIKEGRDSHIVALPARNQEGQLEIVEKEIYILDKFNKGYLPYTKENIIRQGFKFYGEEYGWGGKDNKRDCSALIMDIHRTFGLKLPRNSIEQGVETIGKIHSKENIPPASLLYMPGHTMLYLGEHEGLGYILHQFSGYYEEGEEGLNYIEMMRTDVTPITIKTSNGKTYMEMISICKEFIMD